MKLAKEKIMQTLEYYKSELEKEGHVVLYIGLYGSNNYNLDDEFSDIDAKAIILPTLDNIIFKKTVSNVKEFENGAVDYKDLVTFYNVIKKGNFSFTEPFHSNYFIGDEYFRELFQQIETNKMGIVGGAMEKRKALTHEYPSKKAEFDKYGCDPKQFHHILRLYDLFFSGNLFLYPTVAYLDYCESPTERKFLTKIKREMCGYTIEEMIEEADEKILEMREALQSIGYKYQESNFEKEIADYIKKKITKLLIAEEASQDL